MYTINVKLCKDTNILNETTVDVRIDNTKPEIISIHCDPPLQYVNKSINVSTIIYEDSIIDEVNIVIQYPDMIQENISIIQNKSEDVFFYNHTFNQHGEYNFKIWVKDICGNQNTSNVQYFWILEGFFLNLDDFPIYDAEEPHREMCGPAVAQMTLNYIWWNQTKDPDEPPYLFDSQFDLYQNGVENNSNVSLPYLDTVGLWHIIQDNRPQPYSEYGYNFAKYSNDNLTETMKRICLWINYTIGTYGGYKPGHPLHVPAMIPAYGDYSNWMAVRGIHTNKSCYPLQEDLSIFGFWINDPLPQGIGSNSYKSVTQWIDTYYKPMDTDDQYNNKYVAIVEPPQDLHEQDILLIKPKEQLNEIQKNVIQNYRGNKNMPLTLKKLCNTWIVQAAIYGLREELLPYDKDLSQLFDKTKPINPIFVQNKNGRDYYIVSFGEIGAEFSSRISNISIVVLIDGYDGHFLEASWVNKPVEYNILSYKSDTLYYSDGSPYYPIQKHINKT
ncbi:MAG: hypothetical protein GF364_05400 [Candidatus Lokiarchaeota archaeon]|nr:hypothetical protein [Candidatus Lokiarchaeota archaeon]